MSDDVKRYQRLLDDAVRLCAPDYSLREIEDRLDGAMAALGDDDRDRLNKALSLMFAARSWTNSSSAIN